MDVLECCRLNRTQLPFTLSQIYPPNSNYSSIIIRGYSYLPLTLYLYCTLSVSITITFDFVEMIASKYALTSTIACIAQYHEFIVSSR